MTCPQCEEHRAAREKAEQDREDEADEYAETIREFEVSLQLAEAKLEKVRKWAEFHADPTDMNGYPQAARCVVAILEEA